MTARYRMHEHATREALAAELAGDIVQVLLNAIGSRGEALLAVSGGKTPKLLFQTLAREDVDWRRVTVTLVDERFVPPSSPRSNESFIRRNLLRDEAAEAGFAGLYRPAATVEMAAEMADEALSALPFPADYVVLGMGSDGHTASFFPDAVDLGRLLDAHSPHYVLPVHAASAGEDRLTLPLSRILSARNVALHIEGEEKKETLARALASDDANIMPVRAVLADAPVEIHWAP